MNSTADMEHISAAELDSLLATKSEAEWDAACDAIKAARGGAYPTDWYFKVIVGGIITASMKNWTKA